MKYNENYYHDNSLWQLRPPLKAINTYKTKDGIVIGMFQGNRGEYPEIDFKVKILQPNIEAKAFPPPHSFWVVDLMLKIIDFRKEVKEILEYYLKFYDSVSPFNTPEERINYKPKTVDYIMEKYGHIEQPFTLSLEYVAIIIELFCVNEKRNSNAVWFRNLLKTLLDYTNGNVDYIKVMQASQAGYR
jgi:hypothetical protein